MNITVEHNALKNTLELIEKVSIKHPTLPVLQCVLLEVKDNILTLRGTNLDIAIEATINITEYDPGVIGVSASTFLQTISLISQKEITLKTDNKSLFIETSHSKTIINAIPTDEFPIIPTIKETGQVIQGKLFSQGIKTAAFAASQSSIKPELGSIYIFQKKEHTLTFVATDSFRLIEKTLPEQNVVLENQLLIPVKNALELARVCEFQEDNPTLMVNENQCALKFKNVYITSRLTTGTFPDYEQIIPKEYMLHTTLLTNDLLTALKKTNVFLNKFLQLTIEIKKDTLTLISKGDDGTTTEVVKVVSEGDPLTLNFNQRYIQDIIPFIIDDSITIHAAGIGRPIVVEGVHDRSLRYLVMPMNK